MKNNHQESFNDQDQEYTQLVIIDEEKGMLYPAYNPFSEKFPDFICQICLSFVINPIECGTCDCIFCKHCIRDYTLYSKHCPNRCNINFRQVNRILKNMINQVRVNCLFFHKGCKEILNYENYEKHIKNCEYSPFMCLKCHYVDIKAKIISHCKICDNSQKERIFRCKHCNLFFGKFDDNDNVIEDNDNEENDEIHLLVHEYICNDQFITCKFCDRRLTLREMRSHINNNKCTIAQMENKIEFLNEKIKFYEKEIEKKIENVNLSMMPKDKYRFEKKETCNKEKEKEIVREIISKNNKNEFNIREESASKIKSSANRKHEFTVGGEYNKKGSKLIKVELYNKKIYNKSNSISSIILSSNKLCKDKTELIFSYSDYNLEIDTISLDTNTSSILKKISLKEIESKSTKILLMIKIKNDYFFGTENAFYYLYDANFTLIRYGKPAMTAITCALALPNDNNLIAIGTLNSNLLIINPYINQVLYTLPQSKKRILSLSYIKNTLISSSTKENAFYLWEPPTEENEQENYELKTTIKEHTGWVWTTLSAKIFEDDYLITGGGDKRIIIWKVFEQEKSVRNCLVIKGHTESITCLKCLCVNTIKEDYIIISGSYDGVIKINTIEKLDNIDENDIFIKEIFVSKCLISIFNKEDIISEILPYKGKEEDTLIVVVNCQGYHGYIINEINCIYS